MKKITLLLIFLITINYSYGQYNYFGTNLPVGADGITPLNITPFNGKIYFSGLFKKTSITAGIYYDRELGYFDPTDNSYGELANINTIDDFSGYSAPSDFFEFNGYLYFIASSGAYGTDRELYRTDGVTVALFKDVAPANLSGFPQGSYPQFIVMNGKLYFFATSTGSNSQNSLWQTDGTSTNTINVSNISFADYADSSKRSVIVYNNELYFSGYENLGSELYKFNDASNTTSLVKELFPGVNGGSPRNFTIFNNKLFFSAYTPGNGGQINLCKTDGTTTGTTDILDSVLFSNNPNGLIVVNDKLIYVAFNPNTNAIDLFKCEYNVSLSIYEISLIKHFNPGPNVTPLNVAQEFILFNGNVYFSTSENSDYLNGDVRQVYKTNGTTSGTIKTITINASQIGSGLGAFPRNFFIFNGKLCFYMRDSDIFEQLWISDGTNNYLETLTNVGNGLPFRPDFIKAVKDNILYISATSVNPYNGTELWKIEDTSLLETETFDNFDKVFIYPNPTSNILNIDIQNTSNFETEIYDVVGKKVALFKNQKTVDISNLNNGMYLIKITDLDTNSSHSQKIIKK